MTVLIVESDVNLGSLWQHQLVEVGTPAIVSRTHDEAIQLIRQIDFSVIVLNLNLTGAGAMAVADYASYRRPDAGVIFVSNTSVFADGSIFSHAGNARAMIPADTAPRDIAAMVAHYEETTISEKEVDLVN